MNLYSVIRIALCMSTAFAGIGCTTLLEPRARITDRDRHEAELANIKALTARLETRVESIDAVQQRNQEDALAQNRNAERSRIELDRRIADLEQRIVAQQDRLAILEKQLAAAEQARENDKKVVLETIKSAVAQRPVAMRGREHVVQQGETLSEIAKAYNVTIPAIVRANSLKDAHTIRVGQTLFIPD